VSSSRLRVEGICDLLAVHVSNPARYPFLLESAVAHRVAGRYDILFAQPGRRLSARHNEVEALQLIFAALDEIELEQSAEAESLPFVGGWFLYLGYEMAGHFEPGLDLPPAPDTLPDLMAVECSAAIICDRLAGCTWLVAEDDSALHAMHEDYLHARTQGLPDADPAPLSVVWEEADSEVFRQGVERVREYLLAGDAFQVNLSRAWNGEFPPNMPPWQIYRMLRQQNPAPFGGLMVIEQGAVISCSPERLVTVDQGLVETRPIAGTRRRSDSASEDQRLRDELLVNLKERAEHIMLIDLERNDLGRVCVPGSVEVDELMGLESYPTVHHIVSNIRGRLRENCRTSDVLRAVFPGGTITGCPKVRVMEIIAELEGEGRGAYTGSMGYLSRHGRLDSNILIRTLAMSGAQARLRAGAGIVVDSEPDAELAETRAKANGLLRALGGGL
jgi:anthranilate synthase component 1